MTTNNLKVLICDDSMLVRKKMKEILENCECTDILEAEDGEVAVQMCKEHKPDMVLMDIVMPTKDGLTALSEIVAMDPSIKVVMASSVGTQANLIKSIKMGAYSFLQKPISLDAMSELIGKIRNEGGDSHV